jgi:LysR family transcriptional regulator for metE and metH
MECHPCYRWLLGVVSPYLKQFPSVDVDVRQRFQFGGIGALFSHEIDVLVTPDPLPRKGLVFTPVFDYELCLAVAKHHPLAKKKVVSPEDLRHQTLFTYPVEVERLDIYSQFLLPAEVVPQKKKALESTDIMLQMVESGRGVTALPGWLVKEYAQRLALKSLRLGPGGIKKQIFLGIRQSDAELDHVKGFMRFAKRRDRGGRLQHHVTEELPLS